MATTSFYVLYESASGYGLFSVLETEEIGNLLDEVHIYFVPNRAKTSFTSFTIRFHPPEIIN
jgi:hypothetical protein